MSYRGFRDLRAANGTKTFLKFCPGQPIVTALILHQLLFEAVNFLSYNRTTVSASILFRTVFLVGSRYHQKTTCLSLYICIIGTEPIGGDVNRRIQLSAKTIKAFNFLSDAMDARDLKKFLEGELQSEYLVSQIAAEVDQFRTASRKKGSSIPFHVANEDFRYSFGKADVRRLCCAFLDGRFNEWHLSFLCNVVEMSPSFVCESDEIEDVVSQLSNPEDDVSISSSWANTICNCQ